MPPEESNEIPEAIPMPRETLRKVRVELQDLPKARLTSETKQVIFPEEELEEEPEQEEQGESSGSRPAPRRAPRPEPIAKQPASINRKALESTNRGKNPNSRTFVRGILHPAPFKILSAAFFVIVFRLVFVASLVFGALILFEKVEVDGLMLAWFGLLPLAGFLHLITAQQARCRVCGQKEFIPSRANKHRNTHRFLFTGPIVSTALHVLLFKWFRCMFCGTAVRTKK
ncbi:hypothetical protein AAFN60_11580 [Roseibacillus persicicus]|uniref:hypothetical protein n=1 Tax=Roseibacillus persicicus TaxID=454148 RepID=UPI00398A9155